MDRFIAVLICVMIIDYGNLKSNMDRFIAVVSVGLKILNGFKIQYG